MTMHVHIGFLPYSPQMDSKYVITIPNTRRELETTRDRLRAANAPPQHADFIDQMLADVDAGKAQCLPEDA
jgi:hypothetical protein